MIASDKVLVFDVDGTLCPIKQPHEKYEDLLPYADMVEKLRQYKNDGYHIIISSSRHMRTEQGNVGAIVAKYSHILIGWLKQHGIPHDEVHFGKPWPGADGFYVDDRSIRPDEFLRLSHAQIQALLKAGRAP